MPSSCRWPRGLVVVEATVLAEVAYQCASYRIWIMLRVVCYVVLGMAGLPVNVQAVVFILLSVGSLFIETICEPRTTPFMRLLDRLEDLIITIIVGVGLLSSPKYATQCAAIIVATLLIYASPLLVMSALYRALLGACKMSRVHIVTLKLHVSENYINDSTQPYSVTFHGISRVHISVAPDPGHQKSSGARPPKLTVHRVPGARRDSFKDLYAVAFGTPRHSVRATQKQDEP